MRICDYPVTDTIHEDDDLYLWVENNYMVIKREGDFYKYKLPSKTKNLLVSILKGDLSLKRGGFW